MNDDQPFPFILVAPYGGGLRSVSLAVSDGRSRMMHQHLTPEECVRLARLLLVAAEVAEQDEVTPDSMSLKPGEVAHLTTNGERIAA